MERSLLEKISSPSDLKSLSYDEIDELCRQIRDFLIEVSSVNGGHLASNLGVTELSVALHRVFDSPSDHIIFDVGHQSYVHKILTGRRDSFSTLRTTGGISGFTKMSESVHDAFGAGHSSTSISAALGYAEADKIKGSGAYSIAVVGDGAYTGGMIHEALNNATPDLKLIIILNENGMSISVNKGSFARYLTGVRASKGYNDFKKNTKSFLSHIPFLGKAIDAMLGFFKQKFKSLFLSSNYFEDLGLYYIGPIDGNDYKKVEKTLQKAKKLGKCVVVHIKTTKGKGYIPAEKEPEGYHSVALESTSGFHGHFVNELILRAKQDKSIVAVTPAMGKGTGFERFGQDYPNRYFDDGIAEEHAVTISAALAAGG
ncbi:MAG: 1-deoxy-D-xylulose-5-phosphate synthase, partial [Clostridia bacterium]|nr:1-deoxy-D-xylulose-5-phosphate synthase [Clostridia bacterium]